MAVKNIRAPRGHIIIPTSQDIYAKINITDDSGTVHTVMQTFPMNNDANTLTNSPNPTMGFWDFDGDATDASGRANNLTVANVSYVAGKLGQAISFNGSTSSAIKNSFTIGNTTPQTFCAWVNPDDLSVERGLMSYAGLGAISILANGKVQVEMQGNTTGNSSIRVWSDGTVPTGSWTHIAVVLLNVGATNEKRVVTECGIYINGVLQSKTSQDIGASAGSSGNLRIGDYTAGVNVFSGLLDDVRLYAFLLRQTHIDFIYNAGTGTTSDISYTYWVPGKVGSYARHFYGKNTQDYYAVATATVPSYLAVDYTHSMSFSFWIKSYNTGSVYGYNRWQGILSRGSYDCCGFQISNESLTTCRILFAARKYPTTTLAGITKTNISCDAWHHVVGTYDATARSLYFHLDGVIDSTGTSTSAVDFPTPSTIMYLGSGLMSSNSSTVEFDLDDLRIYPDKVLTSAEVTALYACEEVTDELAMKYEMEEGTGFTIHDTSISSDEYNFVYDANITLTDTNSIGKFNLSLSNDEGRFVNTFNGGELIEFYADKVDGSTLLFRGKVDNVNYGLNGNDGFYANIDGRDYPEIIDKTITGTSLAEHASVSLARLLNDNFPSIKLSFWENDSWHIATYTDDAVTWDVTPTTFPTTLINISYQNKKGWSNIVDICESAGLSCYLQYSSGQWYLRTLVPGTKTNLNSGVSYGVNLLNMNEIGVDNNEITNRVICYGKVESSNIILLKTENDVTSQSNLWIKDGVINDASLTSMEQVQSRVDTELIKGTSQSISGRATILFDNFALPGDTIICSVPYTPLNGEFNVKQVTHNFGDEITTTLEFNKKIRTIKDLFTPKIDPDEISGRLGNNINGMTDSYTVYFNEDSSKLGLDNCEIANGRLSMSTNALTATCTTEIINADYDVTQCEFRSYNNFNNQSDVYKVTNDGINWETYGTSGNAHTFVNTGDKIGFKIEMNRANLTDVGPIYESAVLLYK